MLPEELRQDLVELRGFLSQASRENVRNLLAREISQLESKLAKEASDISVSEGKVSMKTLQNSAPLPTVKLTTYAFDESSNFVKLYFTLSGVENVPKESTDARFSEKSCEVRVTHTDGKVYEYKASGLVSNIIPAESYLKLKKDTVLLMLKKAEAGNTWTCLTAQEKQIKDKKFAPPKMEKDEDPGASIQKMMKQMYDDGDDDMKRTIKKAWWEAQNKKMGGDGMDLGMNGLGMGDE